MGTKDEALAYAEEVYAACATIGFAAESVAALKALIDASARGDDVYSGRLAAAAERAHVEAANWAGRHG